jgi:hypothetical protein
MANVDFEEGDDILDYWNNYDFSWKSSTDVEHFVDAAVACGAYENSLELARYLKHRSLLKHASREKQKRRRVSIF